MRSTQKLTYSDFCRIVVSESQFLIIRILRDPLTSKSCIIFTVPKNIPCCSINLMCCDSLPDLSFQGVCMKETTERQLLKHPDSSILFCSSLVLKTTCSQKSLYIYHQLGDKNSYILPTIKTLLTCLQR